MYENWFQPFLKLFIHKLNFQKNPRRLKASKCVNQKHAFPRMIYFFFQNRILSMKIFYFCEENVMLDNKVELCSQSKKIFITIKSLFEKCNRSKC